MEQRYRAVLQVQAGVPVTEVAAALGVSRQAVPTRVADGFRPASLAVEVVTCTAYLLRPRRRRISRTWPS
jgi:Homeodomain-like domain